MAWTGPIEMEDADLSVISPSLSTPDLERRDTGAQDRTKKDGPGKDGCVLADVLIYHLSELYRLFI